MASRAVTRKLLDSSRKSFSVRESCFIRKIGSGFESNDIKISEKQLVEKQEGLQKMSYYFVDIISILKQIDTQISSNIEVFGSLNNQMQSFRSLSTSQTISTYSQLMYEKMNVVSNVYTRSSETFEVLLQEVKRNTYFAENAQRDIAEVLGIVDEFLVNKEETLTKIYEGLVT